MRIDIWTDIFCPFCYIGGAHFDKALDTFPHRDQVSVEYHRFQLIPEAPGEYDGRKSYETLADLKGIPVESALEMYTRVQSLGELKGLTMNTPDTEMTNSIKCHRLIHYAASQRKQSEAVLALYQTNFTATINISDDEALIGVARSIGLDENATRAVLASDRPADDAKADLRTARSLGTCGVPHFVINDTYAVSGVQGVETFSRILDRIWRDTHSIPAPEIPTSENVCTEESCA